MNKTRNFWHSVHALRGFAALLVVVHHIPQYLLGRVPSVSEFELGAIGVDIFFAISGFVMYFTALKAGGDWRNFAIHRAARVLPLYWLCTLTLGLSAILAPFLFKNFSADISSLVKSLFFTPVYSPNGELRPLLQMGWTLYYEITFYAATGLFIFFATRHAALFGALTILAGIVLIETLGVTRQNSILILLSPIAIEFLFGVCIACLVDKFYPKISLSVVSRTTIVSALIFGSLYLAHAHHAAGLGWDRLLHWGISGALLLLAVLMVEDLFSLSKHLSNATGTLGDISYSLYLTHGFSISIGYKLSQKIGASSFYALASIMIITSLVLAYLVHHLIENRINLAFRNALTQPKN